MDRKEVLRQLLTLDPMEALLKEMYRKKMEVSNLSNEQMLYLCDVYEKFARNDADYQILRNIMKMDLGTFTDDQHNIFTQIRAAQGTPDFTRLLRGYIQAMQNDVKDFMQEERQEGGLDHFTKEKYFPIEDYNLQLVKHTRYSRSDMHDHDFIEMPYMFTGTSHHTFIINGQREKHQLKEGDFLLIPPGMSHEVEIYDDSLMMNIVINRETFQESFLRDLPKGNILFEFFCNIVLLKSDFSHLIFHTHKNEDIHNVMLDLIYAYAMNTTISSKMCDHYLSILFLNILQNCGSEDIEVSAVARKAAGQMIPMMTYMQKNFAKASLEKVAEEFHYSVTYTNRIFKKYTGTTVSRYLQELKFTEARKLLEESELSVEEVCYAVGYQDISYFIEQFKKRYQATPYQYRLAAHGAK